MDFNIQSKISNFIEDQFPQFYKEEGDIFILFVKTYYEWLETEGNVTLQSRKLLNYRDIDATLESFLEHFQKKYLYGIPFDVIINKRYLLKHILDVYRSKSSIQGYKLLFRLIYDEDIDVYLPGRDVIRASDGVWVVPRYTEVSYSNSINSYIGKEIEGTFSGTRAIVETYVTEYFEESKINIVYLSNIIPKSGDFIIGEKLVLKNQISNTTAIASAPVVLGSLNTLEIINGGQGLSVGDNIKIKSVANNVSISHGRNGIVKVSNVSKGVGSLSISIVDGGWGYMANSLTFLYPGATDTTGSGASFLVDDISDTEVIEYNTDVLASFLDTTLDAGTYGFTSNTSANLSSTIEESLNFDTGTFGKIFSLQNIRTGQDYTEAANCFVRSTLQSNVLTGNISYNTTSKIITGTGTAFNSYFTNNSCIVLQANASLANTIEYHIIKTVTNATSMTLYGKPSKNSIGTTSTYRIAPSILKANFIDGVYTSNGSIVGENEFISGYPSIGNNVVNAVALIDSGKGYLNNELVKLYTYGTIENVSIDNGGTAYSNGDLVMFISSKLSGKSALGTLTTNSTGGITTVNLSDNGSGYEDNPVVYVRSNTGSGAVLSCTVTDFSDQVEILGKVIKKGIGQGKGYWQTTRGFLNSDRKIHDSYYYQDFSYEINVALPLAKYKEILYNTFHVAGTELFGKIVLYDSISSNIQILSESISIS